MPGCQVAGLAPSRTSVTDLSGLLPCAAFFSSVLRDIRMERIKVRESDTVRFLYLSAFFLEFFLLVYRDDERRGISHLDEEHGHDFGMVAEMTEPHAIGFVTMRMKNALEEKVRALLVKLSWVLSQYACDTRQLTLLSLRCPQPPLWTDLHAGVECFTQIVRPLQPLLPSLNALTITLCPTAARHRSASGDGQPGPHRRRRDPAEQALLRGRDARHGRVARHALQRPVVQVRLSPSCWWWALRRAGQVVDLASPPGTSTRSSTSPTRSSACSRSTARARHTCTCGRRRPRRRRRRGRVRLPVARAPIAGGVTDACAAQSPMAPTRPKGTASAWVVARTRRS